MGGGSERGVGGGWEWRAGMYKYLDKGREDGPHQKTEEVGGGSVRRKAN